MWSYHRIGHGDFLGELVIPLSTYTFDNPEQAKWHPLLQKVGCSSCYRIHEIIRLAEIELLPHQRRANDRLQLLYLRVLYNNSNDICNSRKKSSLLLYHGWCYSQTRDSTRALGV